MTISFTDELRKKTALFGLDNLIKLDESGNSLLGLNALVALHFRFARARRKKRSNLTDELALAMCLFYRRLRMAGTPEVR